jgi:taurine--2-oxoglutarate transaminase
MEHPFYISWTKQKNATQFDILTVDGAKFKTTNNREIIDMTSISYQAHFGYNHPTIINALKKQLDSIPMSSPKGNFNGKKQATVDLLKYMNKEAGKIFYTTGGAETIENALKIARDFTKKKLVLARQNSYHGATMGALSVTGDWRNPAHQLPSDWVVRIPEPTELDSVKTTRELVLKHGPQNFAALIVETITGGNGVIIPTQEWWDGITSICNEFKILLIVDEVICGFNRTGKPFGYMHFNINPDLICLAKGISGGMIPFGALWTSPEIANYYEENVLCCGLTNYAHPMGIAAMVGVLEIVQDKIFQENQSKVQKVFSEELDKMKSYSNVVEIRSIGHIAAIDLTHSIEWKDFFEAGIYLVAQTKRIIIAPPLIIDEATLRDGMKRIQQVLEKNQKAVK